MNLYNKTMPGINSKVFPFGYDREMHEKLISGEGYEGLKESGKPGLYEHTVKIFNDIAGFYQLRQSIENMSKRVPVPFNTDYVPNKNPLAVATGNIGRIHFSPAELDSLLSELDSLTGLTKEEKDFLTGSLKFVNIQTANFIGGLPQDWLDLLQLDSTITQKSEFNTKKFFIKLKRVTEPEHSLQLVWLLEGALNGRNSSLSNSSFLYLLLATAYLEIFNEAAALPDLPVQKETRQLALDNYFINMEKAYNKSKNTGSFDKFLFIKSIYRHIAEIDFTYIDNYQPDNTINDNNYLHSLANTYNLYRYAGNMAKAVKYARKLLDYVKHHPVLSIQYAFTYEAVKSEFAKAGWETLFTKYIGQ